MHRQLIETSHHHHRKAVTVFQSEMTVSLDSVELHVVSASVVPACVAKSFVGCVDLLVPPSSWVDDRQNTNPHADVKKTLKIVTELLFGNTEALWACRVSMYHRRKTIRT